MKNIYSMRKIFLALVFPLLSLTSASAQITIDSAFRLFHYNTENKITFEKVITSEIDKSEMFKNAKKWVALNYRDYKSVVNVEDEANGILIYKGISAINDGMSHRFSYTVEMTIKNRKARLRLYDIYNLTYAGYPMPIESTLQVFKDRNKNNPKANGEFVYQQYNLFSSLLSEIAGKIIVKDDF
jgi:hypothetical protein